MLRIVREAECQGKEGSSLLSPTCLPLRRQRQAESLQRCCNIPSFVEASGSVVHQEVVTVVRKYLQSTAASTRHEI